MNIIQILKLLFCINIIFAVIHSAQAQDIMPKFYFPLERMSQKISTVKTVRIGKVPVDDPFSVQSCGGLYFYGGQNSYFRGEEVKYEYLKFDPALKVFFKKLFEFDLRDKLFQDIFLNTNYACRHFSVNGRDSLYLVANHGKSPHSLLIENGIAKIIWGYFFEDQNDNVIVFCYLNICENKYVNENNIDSKKIKYNFLPEDVNEIQYISKDIIVYKTDGSKFFNERNIFCQYIKLIGREIDLESRINMCSLIMQNYHGEGYFYNFDGYIFFLPSNINGEFVYYYKCEGLNKCVSQILQESFALLSGGESFEKGEIYAYGGHTPIYSDTFGPNFLFCIEYSDGSLMGRCIEKENLGKNNQSRDDQEYLDVIYKDGKFYFINAEYENSTMEIYVEEIR